MVLLAQAVWLDTNFMRALEDVAALICQLNALTAT
jgi:hypothetical protein